MLCMGLFCAESPQERLPEKRAPFKGLNWTPRDEKMVEAAGIEPASVSPLLTGPTCLVCL